jgi:putative flippase GtrA
MLQQIANIIRGFLLWIRSIFFRFIPEQTYLYLACGGFNLLFDFTLFYIFYHFIFKQAVFHTPIFTFSAYIASLLATFCFTFPAGFYLGKYVVWTQSPTKGRIQLFRYFVVVLICILLNIFLGKLFYDVLHFYAMPSRVISAVFVVITSYLLQQFYTFQVHKAQV